jgi:hypothetical protein
MPIVLIEPRCADQVIAPTTGQQTVMVVRHYQEKRKQSQLVVTTVSVASNQRDISIVSPNAQDHFC